MVFPHNWLLSISRLENFYGCMRYDYDDTRLVGTMVL